MVWAFPLDRDVPLGLHLAIPCQVNIYHAIINSIMIIDLLIIDNGGMNEG